MGYTKIASVAAGSGNSGVSVTTGAIDTTGADLIVVAQAIYNGNGTATVTDNKGNTYTPQGAYTQGFLNIEIWWCFNPTVGTGHTFTYAGVTAFASIGAIAFSGGITSPHDQENGAGSASTQSLAPGSVTPTQDNELLITALCHDNTITGLAVGGGFTKELEVAYLAGNHEGFGMGYLIQTSLAAANPAWTWTTARPAVATISAFKAAAVAPPDPFVKVEIRAAP